MLKPIKFTLEEYRAKFMDIDFWREVLQEIGRRHSITVTHVDKGQAGTFPTFIINKKYVFKLFGELFGPESYEIELEAVRIANQHFSFPTSKLIADGRLFPPEETWQWPYLILTYLEGEPYSFVRNKISEQNQLNIDRRLAALVKEIHSLPLKGQSIYLQPSWQYYRNFMVKQSLKAVENHQKWQNLPDHLIEQIPAYLNKIGPLETAGLPRLLHADLHDEHLLGKTIDGEWEITGIIDWGDAISGDIYYELPPLHLDTFNYDKRRLRNFLAAYNWPENKVEVFVGKAMTVSLLHEFQVLKKADRHLPLDNYKTLEELATDIWNYKIEREK